tara:strand:+ start:396 stop:2228 length:1833 start_codon:yes stop_codon:yes gene_type:complete
MGMKQWMTFGIKTEGGEKAKKDIDGVATASKNAEKSQEGLNDSIESGTGALDKMTGGAITAFKGVVGGVKKAVLGMKTLKGAIIATGVGALVVVVGSLVAYFTQTKRGMEVLQVASAALGAVMGQLTDAASWLGETLINVFTSPMDAISGIGTAIENFVMDKVNKLMDGLGFLGSAFKKLFAGDFSGAMADGAQGVTKLNQALNPLVIVGELVVETVGNIVEGVKEMAKDIYDAVSAATALENRAIKLSDAQRELSVEFAQTRAKMVELKKTSEDVNETIENRIKATEEAGALEQALADKSMALAQEAVDIRREQNEISESTAEDLQALADLEIALSNAQIESAGKQTEILMKVNSLYKEQEANIIATEAAEQQRITDLIARQTAVDDIVDAGRAREIQKIKDHWIEQKRIAGLEGQVLVGTADAQRIQIAAVNKKYDDAEIKATKVTTQQKLGIAAGLIGSLMALNSALSGASKKEQKASFQRNKQLGIVSAVINTAGAIIGAINPAAGGIPMPWGAVSASAAALAGAAQIAVISKSRFNSSDTSVAPPPSMPPLSSGGGGVSSGATTPQLDLGFLGEGSGGSIKAYVISENVTNQQQADQIVTEQTTL